MATSDSKISFHETNDAIPFTGDVPFQPSGSFAQNNGAHPIVQVQGAQPVDGSQIQMLLPNSADFLSHTHHIEGSSSCNSPYEENHIDKVNCVLKDQNEGPSNTQVYQRGMNNKPAALKLKAEKLSQVLASCVVDRLNTGSTHDIKVLIKNGLMSLFDSDKSRKRTSQDASLVEASDPKRKRVACEFCTKTMERQCDLK